MGFRYRKSVNLGGGFRINLSKSGIGYSWGTKGYRITKTANGSIRQSFSIPGSGISFVDEIEKNRPRNKNVQKKYAEDNSNIYGTENIVNSKASNIVSSDLKDILSSARHTLFINCLANIAIALFLVFSCYNVNFLIPLFIFCGAKAWIRKVGTVNLYYTFDDYQQRNVSIRMGKIVKATQSRKVWRVTESSKVRNTKYSAGASSLVKRSACQAKKKVPFPFSTNAEVVSFKFNKETIVFLPDKLFIIQGLRIGALNYDDIMISVGTTRFIEDGLVPKDTRVVGKTWRYVNKSGGPDKRFNYNKELPVCLYGQIKLKSSSGLNTIIMFSNPASD